MKLVVPKLEHKTSFESYINTWNNESIIPGMIKKDVCFEKQLLFWQKNSSNYIGEYVPSSIYFFMDEDENEIYGALSIRQELNDYLKLYGGHIGYGISPKYRNLGYGTMLLLSAKEIFSNISSENILLVITKTNYASLKVAEKVGATYIKNIKNIDTIMYHYEIKMCSHEEKK